MQLEIGLSAADSPHNGFLCWLVPQGAHAVTIDPGDPNVDQVLPRQVPGQKMVPENGHATAR